MTYQYDQLGRLIAAATTGPEWGQSYVFDGFGNLTQQVVTKGTAPSMSMVVDPATNRLGGSGVGYDAVGNLTSDGVNTFTYDGHNRLRTATGETYSYSSKNQRLVVTRPNGTKDFHLYGAFGELLGVYNVITNPGGGGLIAVRQASKERVYFGGRLMYLGGEKVISDRLGSVMRHGTASYRYYPYGQEIGGATANDKPKFGTYTRDASTGLDYAWNRYYQAGWGRFTSPDPSDVNIRLGVPGSWNRYAYLDGDPVMTNDPTGLGFWSFVKSLFGGGDESSSSSAPASLSGGNNDTYAPDLFDKDFGAAGGAGWGSDTGADIIGSITVFLFGELPPNTAITIGGYAPIIYGVAGPQFNYYYIPETGQQCYSFDLNAAIGRYFYGGTLTGREGEDIGDILSGSILDGSMSVGHTANVVAGYQVVASKSGTSGGSYISVPGASVSVGLYGSCP